MFGFLHKATKNGVDIPLHLRHNGDHTINMFVVKNNTEIGYSFGYEEAKDIAETLLGFVRDGAK